jgi:hypothetical protein
MTGGGCGSASAGYRPPTEAIGGDSAEWCRRPTGEPKLQPSIDYRIPYTVQSPVHKIIILGFMTCLLHSTIAVWSLYSIKFGPPDSVWSGNIVLRARVRKASSEYRLHQPTGLYYKIATEYFAAVSTGHASGDKPTGESYDPISTHCSSWTVPWLSAPAAVLRNTPVQHVNSYMSAT